MSNFPLRDGSGDGQLCRRHGVKGGQVVKVTEDGTVGPCADGDAFCGVALAGRRGFCAVQVKGFLTVPITSPVSLGQAALAADGKGGVKTAEEGGVAALVVSVDEAARAPSFACKTKGEKKYGLSLRQREAGEGHVPGGG